MEKTISKTPSIKRTLISAVGETKAVGWVVHCWTYMIWSVMNGLGPNSVVGLIWVGLVGNTLCVLIIKATESFVSWVLFPVLSRWAQLSRFPSCVCKLDTS